MAAGLVMATAPAGSAIAAAEASRAWTSRLAFEALLAAGCVDDSARERILLDGQPITTHAFIEFFPGLAGELALDLISERQRAES